MKQGFLNLIAAAAAAVLLSAEPGLTAAEVQALLCDNALDAGDEGRDRRSCRVKAGRSRGTDRGLFPLRFRGRNG